MPQSRKPKRRSVNVTPGLYRVDDNGTMVRVEESEVPPSFDSAIVDDILAGPPDAAGVDTPDYRGTPGESHIPLFQQSRMGAAFSAQPNQFALENMRAMIHQVEARQEGTEEIIRRQQAAIQDLNIKLTQVLSRMGPQVGMKI